MQTSSTPMNTSQTSTEERSALNKVMWFGILELVGVVASAVAGFYIVSTMFSGTFLSSLVNSTSTATASQVAKALGPVFQDIIYLVPLTLGIELVGLVVLTMGFRGLAKVDRARFHISTPFMIVLIVGLLMVVGGAVPLLNAIPNVIASASNCTYPYSATTCTPSSAFFNQFSSVIAYFGLLAIGGILGLIGFIGGLILGLWRVGTRYNQTTIKVGAILQIIPYVSIIGAILIILGANEAKNTLSR